MKEVVLENRKNGMAVLLAVIVLYLVAIAGCVAGGMMLSSGSAPVLLIISAVVLALGWIPLCGLKVLKPQEALVLTLFGKYVGTLKNEGFYYFSGLYL